MLEFIISLIIPLLIWGPFFPDLIVSLSGLFYLIYIYKNNLFYYLKKKPLIIFFAFSLYCILVSIFFSKDILLCFESSLFYFRIGIFACLIWYLIEKNKNILNYFYYMLVICFSALIVDGFVQFFTETNIVGLPKSGQRISSFFGDELIIGSYLSRLFPLLFAFFLLKEKNQTELYFMSILFILMAGLIYISGERAAFFLLVLSYFFIMIFSYYKYSFVSSLYKKYNL
jgi:hypothetical protein